MHLHLITSRDDRRFLQEVFEVGDGTVADADGTDFAGGDEFFHFEVGFDVGPGCAGAG